MKDKDLLLEVTYQVSHDSHYNLVIHMINGDNIQIERHHIDENLTAINQLLKKNLPYYFYEVKGIHPYRTTFFTATKLRLLRDALATAE